MSISGPLASQQIQRAYQRAQQALADARREASSTTASLQQIANNQRDALGDLAQHYLPDLSRDSLNHLWSDLRQGVEAVLLRQQDRIAQLSQSIDQMEQQRDATDRDAETANHTLDEALNEQQRISQQLADQLAADTEFQTLTKRAAEAEAALERAEGSLEEIEHEASQKLPAYENSRLFRYLYDRGLATPQYTERGLTRRLDRWVSRLIGFPEARIGYEYLKRTPEQVRKLISQDRDALDVVMMELQRQHDDAAQQLGLPAVVHRVETAEQERDEILAELRDLDEQLDQRRSQLTEVADPVGPFYREAIEYIRSSLGRAERTTLASRARRTPDPRDDQIVARMDQLDEQLRSANTDSVASQQRIQWLDRHLNELGQFHQRFRAAGFDSSRSQFDGSVNLETELELVRDGRGSIDSVWQQMRRRQRFAASSNASIGTGLGNVMRHPMTQVLVHAMASAAADALTDHASRAGRRYTGQRSYRTPTVRTGRGPGTSNSRSRPSRGRSQGGFYTDERI